MMKGTLIYSSALVMALLTASCSSENVVESIPDSADHNLTFTLRTPAGEKVGYTKALHDSPEYAINSLTLYEYEVADDGSTSLARVMSYPDGNGKNSLNPVDGGNGTYTFSIIVPAANDGKKYSYKFVANDATPTQSIGSDFNTFSQTLASLTFGAVETPTADLLAKNGIAMSGVAVAGGNEILTMSKGLTCDVNMTRIVSRVDIRHQIPNLKITEVTLHGAPQSGFLFPQSIVPLVQPENCVSLGLNTNVVLPADYLNRLKDIDEVNLKKAFYLYERQNSDENSAYVNIKYTVDANSTEYVGEIDVPFRTTGENPTAVHAQRNHLYTIVLGNGTDPIAGKVTARLIVDDWNLVEVDEPLTDDDPERN